MNKFIKSSAIVLLAAAGFGLGGCVYYPVRPTTGVVYDGGNGNAVVDDSDSYAAAGGDYYGPYYGYYDPYLYGWGYPAFGLGLGFYGGYGYWGGHGYRGPWRGRGGWGGGRAGFSGARGGFGHASGGFGHR
jgi:hypothetical protein